MRILIYLILLLYPFNLISGQKKQKRLSDDELMTLVQKQTFRYFWDFAHPESGLAHERSNGGAETATIGGSGFGVMAIIVGIERGFMTREQGLLAAHQYFIKDNPTENRIRGMINNLWRQAEWNFFTQGQDVMYWHWSPYNGWAMNHQIKGHNECHIIYILGASSPTYPIAESVYHKGWVNANTFLNGREYYGIRLPLGNDNGKGGPLFFTHYSYMGLDPHGLKDRYADYEEQMKAHTLINRAYCIDNPKGYKGYGEKCWGLTASDGDKGYSAHSPGNDRGVITPTAALSSIPYTPEYSLEAMRYFYEELGDRLWGEYGFKDAFNLTEDWFAPSYLAIDQGPIIVMIENYRTGLIWKLFMSHPDVQKGLKRLGFTSPYLNKAD